eukprot:918108-Lingulodinium_polyedra.AAC.1
MAGARHCVILAHASPRDSPCKWHACAYAAQQTNLQQDLRQHLSADSAPWAHALQPHENTWRGALR